MTHHTQAVLSTHNIHAHTTQQVYDFIVDSVIAQGVPSVSDDGTCEYRGPGGLKCAAGHLVLDADMPYLNEKRFDGAYGTIPGWDLGLLHDLGWKRLDDEDPEFHNEAAHIKLVERLQTAHDFAARDSQIIAGSSFLEAFKARAVTIALEFEVSARAAITAAETSNELELEED